MGQPGQAPAHGDELLMWRMTTSMQIDMARAIRAGYLSIDQLSRMLAKCAGCRDPGSCADYLERRDDGLTRPPDFCPNMRNLMLLREGFGPETDAPAEP